MQAKWLKGTDANKSRFIFDVRNWSKVTEVKKNVINYSMNAQRENIYYIYLADAFILSNLQKAHLTMWMQPKKLPKYINFII